MFFFIANWVISLIMLIVLQYEIWLCYELLTSEPSVQVRYHEELYRVASCLPVNQGKAM